MSTAGYLQDAKNQQKRLAETITAKGIAAKATEKYKDLVDKVAQIENLKGEERTLENFTNVLSEPKSIVQLEYPEPKNLFDKSTLTAGISIVELTQTTNGFTFKTSATSTTMMVLSNIYLTAGTYYCSGTVTCSDTSYKGGWAVYDAENNKFIINASSRGTVNDKFTITESKTYQLNFYAPYNAPVGVTMTFENVQLEKGTTATPYEPYPAPKILNAKLGGKNLLPYPYAETTKTLNGITIADNGDGSINLNGTSTAQVNFYFSQNLQLKKGITYTLSASGNYSFGGSATFYIYNSTYGSLAYINLNADNSYTFTPTKDINGINCYIVIPSDRTVSGIFKPQLELGTTATDYTPYVDLTTVNVTRCGKNLFNQSLLTDWGLVLTDGKYVGAAANLNGKTLASNFQNNTQYTISLKGYNTNSTTASVLISVNYTDGTSATIIRLTAQSETEYKFTSEKGKTVSSFKSAYYNADTVNISYIQIEQGPTITAYEPYQGQTYTPTASGEVTGITNLYPTTTLLTNNAGVVFTRVLQGTQGSEFIEILPSSGKNGITKINQTIVDSSIDSNITSDNIKQGVSILGVTGDYICNYTYDETTKELVLIL